jgi:hypothetical protein
MDPLVTAPVLAQQQADRLRLDHASGALGLAIYDRRLRVLYGSIAFSRLNEYGAMHCIIAYMDSSRFASKPC